MDLKKIGKILFLGLTVVGLGYGIEHEVPSVIEVIEPYKLKEKAHEEDEFIRIRRERYSNGVNVRKLLYFSRWHEYLNELAEEKLRQREYEDSLREYEKEKEEIVRKIRRQNQSTTYTNVPEGKSVNIYSTNYNNE